MNKSQTSIIVYKIQKNYILKIDELIQKQFKNYLTNYFK